jgi:DNA (cytosine-5)-methyltransferase 1
VPAPLSYLQPGEKLSFRSRKRELTARYKRKAEGAIQAARGARRPHVKLVRGRSYGCRLSGKLELVPCKAGAEFLVAFTPTKGRWVIEVRDASGRPRKGAVIVKAEFAGEDWGLRAGAVEMRLSRRDERMFTAAWKAFEAELSRHVGCADLVQLSNYYQYESKVSCSLSLGRCRDWLWRALQKVVSGRGVAETAHRKRLASLWSIPQGDILSFCSWLKGLGYEVRNSGTNPEIPRGRFLVPYCFPTLGPKSVQLWKALA